MNKRSDSHINLLFIILILFAFICIGCSEIQPSPTSLPGNLPISTQMPILENPTKVFTPTETFTPTPTLIPQISQTVTPQSTKPQEPTAILLPQLRGAGLLSIYRNSTRTGNNYFLDENGNIISKVPYYDAKIQAPGQPCYFYGVNENYVDSIFVRKYNVFGDEIFKKTLPIRTELREKRQIYNLALSPNAEWVTYVWPSGADAQSFMDPLDSKSLDLDLIGVNQTDGIPITITVSGGSTKHGPTWSPDSRFFAYSDHDSSGTDQIYRMDPSSKMKVQLSSFGSAKPFDIRELAFSPDGTKIAFYGTIRHETPAAGQSTPLYWGEGVVGSISIQDKITQFFPLPRQFYNPQGPVWWNQSSNQFMILLQGYGPEQNFYSGDLVAWFDIKIGKIVHQYPDEIKEEFPIRDVFPLKDIDRVLIYRSQPLVYDTDSATFQEIKFLDLQFSISGFIYLNGITNLDSCASFR